VPSTAGTNRSRKPQNSMHVLNCKDGPIAGGPSTAAPSYSIGAKSVVGVSVALNRKVHQYSPELVARMPVKYVLQQSQKSPTLYAGVYSPLLRSVQHLFCVPF